MNNLMTFITLVTVYVVMRAEKFIKKTVIQGRLAKIRCGVSADGKLSDSMAIPS